MTFLFTFKKILNKIIKGARKSPLLFKYMAIKVLGNVLTKDGKVNKSEKESVDSKLTNQEIDFILTKLRDCNYKGSEFEMFYTVWVKISEQRTK